MAKASQADLDMALALSQALECLEKGYFPAKSDDDEESAPFDIDREAHCQQAMNLLMDILGKGSLFRVTFGMLVMLDPRNEIVDPDCDYLAIHPKYAAALARAESPAAEDKPA